MITVHVSRNAQVIPIKNQSAQATAKVLIENSPVHCGFLAKLHSDKGANFVNVLPYLHLMSLLLL